MGSDTKGLDMYDLILPTCQHWALTGRASCRLDLPYKFFLAMSVKGVTNSSIILP